MPTSGPQSSAAATADAGPDIALPIADLSPSHEDYAVDVCERLFAAARQHRASDLHLVPRREGLSVAFRIDGLLQPATETLPGGERIVARLKVLAGLLTYRSGVPQEGRIEREGEQSIRLVTCPTVLGEKAILRWTADTIRLSLGELGLPETTRQRWEAMLAAPQGLLLVTGPAGSGKTTTAYASLRYLQQHAATSRAIVTLEDPVEAVLDGVAQTQLSPSEGWDFAEGLRASLRHDPEVLLVGEIRDPDTIATAVRGALTGHLLLSTLHTSTPAEAIVRILDLGIEPYLVASSLRGVLQQRLVRRRTGGRLLLTDLLDPTEEAVLACIKSRPTTAELAAVAGGRSVLDQARDLLAEGTIDRAEFVRVFGLVPLTGS